MNNQLPWHIDLIPWYIFAAYWAISALRVSRAKATERSVDRVATITIMIVAFVLLFDDHLRTGLLDRRFAPAENWIAWAALGLTSLGVAIAIWARYSLGQYWSARVTLKEDHRLIRSGPYRSVRHPIYTGMLLGAVGRAFTIGEWRGVVAVVLILVAHSLKAKREESLLAREFGEEYAFYCRETGFLFPRLVRSGMDTPAERT
jgi:protein-S-isoprenylcysteine O-methyltransferase Ste14